MSLGALTGAIEWTSSEEESVNRMANEMMRAGVTLFIARGNSGGTATIGTPGKCGGRHHRRISGQGYLDCNLLESGANRGGQSQTKHSIRWKQC